MLADLDKSWSDTYPEEYPRWYAFSFSDLLYDPVTLEDKQLFADLFHIIDIMHVSLIREEPTQIQFAIYEVDIEKIDTIKYVGNLSEEEKRNDVTSDLQDRVRRAQQMFRKSSITPEFLENNPYLMKVTITGMEPWGINFFTKLNL